MCIISHHILFSEESKNQHIPEHLLQIGISQRKTAFIQTYLDAFYLPYSLDKVQINCTSRSLLKPDEEILKTCTYFLSSIRQLSLPRISSPSRKIKKLSAKKSCRKYYRCTADTGSWLKNVIITTKRFAVYILSSQNISIITAILTKKNPKLYS